MALTTLRSMALTLHAFFFREGDAFTQLAPGICAVDAKPDATDPAWIDFADGSAENFDEQITDEEEKKVWKGVPGHLVPKDNITTKQGMMIKLTTNVLSPLAIEAYYRTSQKLDLTSTQFNPLSAVPRKGWLKVQMYDERDNLVAVIDRWVKLKVIGGMKGGDGSLVMPEFEGYVLYSTLNTGSL